MVLSLCEYAAANRDGTFTIIRGGIEFWETQHLPLAVALWLMAELRPHSLPSSESPLLIIGTTAGGEEVFRLDGLVVVASPEKVSRFAIPLQFVAGAYGEIMFRCQIGEHGSQLAFDVRQVQ